MQLDGSGDEHLRTGILGIYHFGCYNFQTSMVFPPRNSVVAIGHLQEPTVGIPQEAPDHNCESLLKKTVDGSEIPNNHRLDGFLNPYK